MNEQLASARNIEVQYLHEVQSGRTTSPTLLGLDQGEGEGEGKTKCAQ